VRKLLRRTPIYRFLSRFTPPLLRILIVESGPRETTEKLLHYFYEVPKSQQVDVLTCYGSSPKTFDAERGTCYSIHDPAFQGNRSGLIRHLGQTKYSAVAALCTGSAVMNKWKWAIAARIPAKVLIVNEHAGFYSLDLGHLKNIGNTLSEHFLPEASTLGVIGELLIAPFTISYLFLYAALIHLRRLLR
jgi:hypothetical protein